ncbi:MAG: hypothetical protein IH584_06300 [Candidatus Aminicenantes bacterium]|nr:hypothetical protein [Candidatus Aminicenantes bacterium]
MMEKLLQSQVPWVWHLADKLPRLLISKTASKPLGNGIFRLEVWVENSSYLPFPTAMGSRNNRLPPAVITLKGDDLTLIEGLKRTIVREVGGGQAKLFTWIIRSQGQRLNIHLAHPTGWDDSKVIQLGGVK